MLKTITVSILISIITSVVIVLLFNYSKINILSSESKTTLQAKKYEERQLDKYTIENLAARKLRETEIVFDEILEENNKYKAQMFHFTTNEKKVTGLAHIPVIPHNTQKLPVVVQLRGYVDQKEYFPGEGTKRSAQVFSENGFLSLAPDFLGFGRSDSEAGDIFESRFQTYTTVLDLISSISSIPFADPEKVVIWGHSNGGQIALTVGEILGVGCSQNESLCRNYPITLWAPVTKPFPYSVLYYTDDADDKGKFLRKELANFENLYNSDKYSLTNYIDYLNIPIQIHQGGADDAVPASWNDEFVSKLKDLQKEVVYYYYENADHNMVGSWDIVVKRDLEFFSSQL